MSGFAGEGPWEALTVQYIRCEGAKYGCENRFPQYHILFYINNEDNGFIKNANRMALGFLILTLINGFQLLKSPDNIDGSLAINPNVTGKVGFNIVHAFLSIPLYAYMILMVSLLMFFSSHS